MNLYLCRPMIVEPRLCNLKDLQDGTYSIDDLHLFHELLDLKQHINKPED